MNQQILDYIKQAREYGMDDASIKQQLLDSGWPESEILNTINGQSGGFTSIMSENVGVIEPRKLNIKKMITKGILGIFAGLGLGFVLGAIISTMLQLPDSMIWIPLIVIWLITIFLFGLWGAKSKTKEEEGTELQKIKISDEGLTRNEKIAAWIFSILNPVITGAIMYYMWRKRYPTKAKQANHISIIVFLIEFMLGILVTFISQ
jgi:hypothetical protein